MNYLFLQHFNFKNTLLYSFDNYGLVKYKMFILPLKLGFIKSMRLDMKAFAKTKSRQDSSMWYISTRSVEFWNSPFTHMYRHQVNSNNAFVEQGCSLGNNHNTDFYLVIESINWLAYSLFELFYLCGNTYMLKQKCLHTYLCFLLLILIDLIVSLVKPENISWKMGWKFLNRTVETANLCSNLEILSLKSFGMDAISIQFFIFVKNCIKLQKNHEALIIRQAILGHTDKMNFICNPVTITFLWYDADTHHHTHVRKHNRCSV